MSRANPILTTFNAGELSPALFGRTDLSKYYNACETLENMISRPHGPAFKRPGTYFVREVIGRDHVTNGNFDSDTDWTKETGWTITGGKAVGAAGSESYIYQDVGDLVEGQVYEIIFTLSDRTAGSVTLSVGDTLGTARTTDAKHTERITCGASTLIGVLKSSDFDGKIDTISARRINPITHLESFQFSTVQAYILEFTDKNLRIYKDNGIILDGADPYELATPYTEDDLFKLQTTQSADVMYIVHPSYAPRKLTRIGHTSWTLTEIDFTNGPWSDQNITETTLTPSYAAWVSGGPYDINDCCIYSGSCYRNKTGVNTSTNPSADSTNWEIITTNFCGSNLIITASDNLFETTHVGAKWRITHNRNETSLNDSFASVTASASIKCKGQWEFITHGTWTGTMTIVRSIDDGDSWQLYRRYTSADDLNVNTTGEEFDDDVIFKVAMSEYTSGTCNFDFLVHEYLNHGIIKINTRNSTTEVICTVIKTLGKLEATKMWSESAWNDYKKYPACVDFFEERLIFAGSTAYPQTIWTSKTGDYENMSAGTYEDDAFIYTIAARGVNPIYWIVPQNVLLIGTKGAEWKMGTPNMEAPLSVVNVSVKRQSTWGSTNIQALLVNDVVLFIQRASTKVRELTEDSASLTGKYIAPDLTMLAEHITKGGIIDIAYQQEPSAVVWCVRNDGVLLGLTYERTQEVVGWHRHLTYEGNDKFESVAINTTTGEDEVWICVQREIGGETRRYIEYFKPWKWGDDRADCFFVDSGLSSDGGTAKTITGVTKANPVVVTAVAHVFSDGDEVRILDILGMVELNENVYTIANKTADTFELTDSDGNNIDGSGFTAYFSGGTAQKVSKSYSGLSHLAGRNVSICADGCVRPRVEVSSAGVITLSEYANKVHAGLGYTSKLQPMNIEAGAQAGTAQGKIKKIHKVTVRLQDTMACKMGTCEDDLEEINFRNDEDAADEAVPLFTGDKDINAFPGDYDTNGTVLITSDAPLSLTVVAILPELKTMDMM